jgi:hypothetical protein
MISPLYGQLSPLRVPTSMRFISNDADVVAYVLAVEAADGTRLEGGVISAYNSFITGCKSDGIWSALKASCILAGARTLSGALVPLVGTAPTNANFVTGDYNRKTGLLGNGSTKYLISNRNNIADPQNSKHLACYISQNSTVTGNLLSSNNGTGSSILLENPSTTQTRCIINGSNTTGINRSFATGFVGASRPNGTQMITRQSGSSITHAYSSATPLNSTISVYTRGGSIAGVSNGRYSFYSIGEHLDLAALDTRVSTLMTALDTQLP